MSECSRISGILLGLKYLYFDTPLQINVPFTMDKDFQQMRCLKGVSVEMHVSAQFRNKGR